MIFERFLSARPAKKAARRLHDSAVVQARAPDLYAAMGAPDTTEGRFELLTLHVHLLVDRLRGAGGEAADLSQALFDTYLRDLDGALREMGVGDLTVPKRMKKLGQAFYGRGKSLAEAFDAPPPALEAMIARTVLAGALDADPSPLADYVRRTRAALALQPLDALAAGEVRWTDA